MGYITITNDDSCTLEDLGQIKLFFPFTKPQKCKQFESVDKYNIS